MSHANARLTLHGRRLLVARVVEDARPVAHVAKELGVSRQCAHRWVRRFRAEGAAGLLDRSSRPHRIPTKTTPDREAAVLAARGQLRFGPARLVAATGVPAVHTCVTSSVGLKARMSAANPGASDPTRC